MPFKEDFPLALRKSQVETIGVAIVLKAQIRGHTQVSDFVCPLKERQNSQNILKLYFHSD